MAPPINVYDIHFVLKAEFAYASNALGRKGFVQFNRPMSQSSFRHFSDFLTAEEQAEAHNFRVNAAGSVGNKTCHRLEAKLFAFQQTL
jgi:hypothetical protein